METQRLDDPGTWRHGALETQRLGDTESRIHRDLDTQRFGDTETWRHRDLDTQRLGDTTNRYTVRCRDINTRNRERGGIYIETEARTAGRDRGTGKREIQRQEYSKQGEKET